MAVNYDNASDELKRLRQYNAPPKEDLNVMEQIRIAYEGQEEGEFKDDPARLAEYLYVSRPKLNKMRFAWKTYLEHRGEQVYELIRQYLERSKYETNMAYQLFVTFDDDQRWEFLHANVPNLKEVLGE